MTSRHHMQTPLTTEAMSHASELSKVAQSIASRPQFSANIKTWQDRVNWLSDRPAPALMVEAMKAEIAELRAALATTAPTVGVDEREAFEAWELSARVAYRDEQYGLCWYNAEAKSHQWIGWQARAKLAGVAIPEGWVLVPVEPTEAMIQSACLHQSGEKYDSYDEWWESHTTGISRLIRELEVSAYRNMLSAAPSPAEQEG